MVDNAEGEGGEKAGRRLARSQFSRTRLPRAELPTSLFLHQSCEDPQDSQTSLSSLLFCLAAQSCLTLCDPMNCCLPGSTVCGISQARILGWVASRLFCPWDQKYCSRLPFPSPGDLPDPGIEPMSPVSPALAGGFLTTLPPGKMPPVIIILNQCPLEKKREKEERGKA